MSDSTFKIDILAFCYCNHIALDKNQGRYRKLTEHDSLVIDTLKNRFIWNSRQVSGDGIDFIKAYYGVTTKEALKISNNNFYEATPAVKTSTPLPPVFNLADIEEAKTNSRIFAYLTKTRKLSPKTVNIFFENNLIRQDFKGNIIFYVKEDSQISGAILKGTLSDVTFNKILPGTPNIGFNLSFGKVIETVYLFEAPIDLMSFIELYPQRAKNADFRSFMGLKPTCFAYVLERHPEANYVFAIDNDSPGDLFYNNILQEYETCKHRISRLTPLNKDWNEDLKRIKA